MLACVLSDMHEGTLSRLILNIVYEQAWSVCSGEKETGEKTFMTTGVKPKGCLYFFSLPFGFAASGFAASGAFPGVFRS